MLFLHAVTQLVIHYQSLQYCFSIFCTYMYVQCISNAMLYKMLTFKCSSFYYLPFHESIILHGWRGNDQVDGAFQTREESAHSILSPCHSLWQPGLAPLGSTESCLE